MAFAGRDHVQMTSTVIGTGRRGLIDGDADTTEMNRPFGICALPSSGGLLAFTDMHASRLNNAVRLLIPRGWTEGPGKSQHGAFAVRTVQNSGLLAPKGIAASADGRHLFVCDSGHHKIRLASIPGQSVLADADVVADGVDMIAFAGCGRKGWKDGLVTECCFNNPAGICERADGSIVVADTGNHCIRLIDRTAGGKLAVRTIGGSFAHRLWSTSSHFGLSRGSDVRNAGYADGVQSLFHSPCGVLDGEFGHVIVADTMNNCIRVLIATNRSREPWKARTLCGQQLPGYADGDCCSARFNQPQSLCWANGGRKDSFFVSDSGNGCVRQIGGCRITKTPDGDKFCVYDWVRTIEIDFIPQCIPQSHAGKRNSQPIVPTGIACVPEPGRQNIAKLTVGLVVCDGGENVIKLVPLHSNMSVTRRHGRSPVAKGSTWSNAATCVDDHDGETSLREAEHLESNQDGADNQRRSEYQSESDGGGCKCNCASALARALDTITVLQAENAQLKQLLYSTFNEVELASKRVLSSERTGETSQGSQHMKTRPN